MGELLSDIEIQRMLGKIPGWSRKGDSIVKTFQFKDFLSGVDFVGGVAEVAEKANHHPDIDIRYNKVTCTLSTHSEDGITQKDLNLAAQIDGVRGDQTAS